MRLGTIFSQGYLCGKRYDRLYILLWHQSGQEEVRRRKDHMLQFDDKKIVGWHGRHHESSMWKEGGVCIPGEIVPERFQIGRASCRERVFLSV